MKTESKRRRYLINSLAILVILAIGLTGVWISPQNHETTFGTSKEDLPTLKTMRVLDLDKKSYDIRIALLVVQKGQEAGFVSDVISAYEWGLKHLPIICDEKDPTLCAIAGRVHVWIIVEDDTTIPTVEGREVHDYLVGVKLMLDAVYIQQLLEIPNINTTQQLVVLHQSVETITNPPGEKGLVDGQISKVTFRWFKNMP